MYARPPWPQPPAGYGTRPPYSASQPGPPTTAAGPTPQGPPYGGQPSYPDQYQVSRRILFQAMSIVVLHKGDSSKTPFFFYLFCPVYEVYDRKK